MFKFYYLNKVKLILIILTLSKYFFWCLFFYFQGEAVHKAINEKKIFEGIVGSLLGFALTKLMMMMIELLSSFLRSYFENKEINHQWKTQFPIRIFQDTENKDNLICLFYFDYLPNLFNLECANIINICTVCSIFSVVLCLVIYTQFYFGLISFLIIFLLSFLSKNIGVQKIDRYQKKRDTSKALIFQWIHQYFKAYREVVFSWQDQLEKWSQEQYRSLYQYNRQILLTHLIRDILSQVLIEIPFIINTCMVILGVYFEYLSVTEMFIWIGLSQFVIQSSNSYLELKLNKIKIRNFFDKIEEVFLEFSLFNSDSVARKRDPVSESSLFLPDSKKKTSKTQKILNQLKVRFSTLSLSFKMCQEREDAKKNRFRAIERKAELGYRPTKQFSTERRQEKVFEKMEIQKAFTFIEVKLQDGTSNTLALTPSLYPIKGKNGSGKTTLLNIILGYERLLTTANIKVLKSMLVGVSAKGMRVVEKDPVIFDSLNLFHHQILGPDSLKPVNWKELLDSKMYAIFTPELIHDLSMLVKEMECKFNSRIDKRFSSGEKVMISFLRVIHSWDPSVSLLIIDECTAFLDIYIKPLFLQCIRQLTQVVAVYLCAHEMDLIAFKSALKKRIGVFLCL